MRESCNIVVCMYVCGEGVVVCVWVCTCTCVCMCVSMYMCDG